MKHCTFRELLLWYLETFRPPPRNLHQAVIGDRDDLRKQGLHITAQKFRGLWFGQQKLHCLRSELRRRALQEMASLCFSTAKRFLIGAYLRGRFSSKSKALVVSCKAPVNEGSNPPNVEVSR